MFSKLWLCYNEAQEDPDKTNIIQMNEVFTNRSEEDKIYPLTVNSLTAMVADMRPLFFELRASLITFPIFVR